MDQQEALDRSKHVTPWNNREGSWGRLNWLVEHVAGRTGKTGRAKLVKDRFKHVTTWNNKEGSWGRLNWLVEQEHEDGRPGRTGRTGRAYILWDTQNMFKHVTP